VGLDTVAFLEHVGREVGGPVQIVWDRSPIHRRAEVRAFVEAVGATAWRWRHCRRTRQTSTPWNGYGGT